MPESLGYYFIQTKWPEEQKRLGPAIQTQCIKQAQKPEIMIAMQMGNENSFQLSNPAVVFE